MKKFIRKIKAGIKKMRDRFFRARSRYIKYYETLPLEEKTILLESEHGKKINGNIFYLLRYLSESPKYQDYQIYVSSLGRHVKKFRQMLDERGYRRVQVVMLASDEYVRLLAGAKYLINDTSFAPYYIKKEGQIYLNTWHGTPLKTLGRSDQSEFYNMGNIQKNFLVSDYLLYPNTYTRDHMIRDYMLENLCPGKVILGGYPRNEIFFDESGRQSILEAENLTGKRVYAYLPTYRGILGDKKTTKDNVYLAYYLFEIDRQLQEDEVLFVNLHPLSQKGINFAEFKNIRPFPAAYETYEFLNAADVLITDYSSVFFDFSCNGKKTVLFPYDKEDYLRDRGMYFSMDELPFPQVFDVPGLLAELRSEKNYDDTAFLQEFCPYENIHASQQLCDCVILGEDTGLMIEEIKNNGKPNVLIYAGNLSANGITTSLRTLLSSVDLNERNYYFTFSSGAVKPNKMMIRTFPEGVNYIATTGDMNLTVAERIYRVLFKERLVKAPRYMKKMRVRIQQEIRRLYGDAKFDTVIQFNGYEQETILRFSAFPCRRIIFVHNDVVGEIRMKGVQRKDVLRYAYTDYDRVAIVTQDLFPATYTVSGKKDNICIVRNTIDYKGVLAKAEQEIGIEENTKVLPDADTLYQFMASDKKKFINIGRFSEEKGHERLVEAFARLKAEDPDILLVIIGGYSFKGGYEKLWELVQEKDLQDSVVLVQKMMNPFPVLKACDYFVLSSFYEGFGLVLAEADILGVPVISTDITGPRLFMQQNGGTLVPDSEEGIFRGMQRQLRGEIPVMNVDYAAYNREVVAEFEELFR